MKIIVDETPTMQRPKEWIDVATPDKDGELGPAIHMRYLDWFEIEQAESLSLEPIVVNNKRSTATNLEIYWGKIIEVSGADAWRGFVDPDGNELPFTPARLLLVLKQNPLLTKRLKEALALRALLTKQQHEDEVKNSDAGPGTKPTAPGRKKTGKKADPKTDEEPPASNA